MKGGGKGERRKRKGQATGFFFGKLELWIAPSIGSHCVPSVKGKGKEEGKENEKGERRK